MQTECVLDVIASTKPTVMFMFRPREVSLQGGATELLQCILK